MLQLKYVLSYLCNPDTMTRVSFNSKKEAVKKALFRKKGFLLQILPIVSRSRYFYSRMNTECLFLIFSVIRYFTSTDSSTMPRHKVEPSSDSNKVSQSRIPETYTADMINALNAVHCDST